MSDKQRFEEIIDELKELLEEAIDLVPEGVARSRAESYWYAHIMCAINDNHEFLGVSMYHMQDCLDEWMEQEDDDDYDEDWDLEAGRPAHMRDEDRD